MNAVENRRFYKSNIVDLENGDSDCIIIYSKRAAEFDSADLDISISDAYNEVRNQDDFGIVSLQHSTFEFLIEKTNLGFSVRAFECGNPDYDLDKLGFGFKLADLLQ